MAKGLIKRGGVWQLRRRVPARFSAVEPRREVIVSLKTDSESEAGRRADRAWQNHLDGWEAQLAGQGATGRAALEMARRDAQRLGVAYKHAEELAAGPVEDLLARMKLVAEAREGGKDVAAEALGLVNEPVTTISVAFDDYLELTAHERRGKTDDQIRKWKNPRRRAIEAMIEAVGDIDVKLFDHTVALAHRNHLLDWAAEEQRSQDTARKLQLTALGIIRKVNTLRGLGLDLRLDGLNIPKDRNPPERQPITAEYIKARWLAGNGGALADMNSEARQIVLMMVNSGARPSEIAGLKVKHVVTDAGCEVMQFRPEDRTLKTRHSQRDLPLVGVSLSAAHEALHAAAQRAAGPDDWLFPRYAEGDTLSATVNKYLRANGLLPDRAVLYGLRHGFRDRLDAAGVQERVCLDLMGHALQSPRYGGGGGDAVRRASVEKIAI